MKEKKNFVFLCSGEGTTFEYLAQLPWVHPLLLLTDRFQCGALKKAEKLNIPFQTLSPRNYSSDSQWDEALLESVQSFLKILLTKWMGLF